MFRRRNHPFSDQSAAPTSVSPGRLVWRRLRQDIPAMMGIGFILVVAALALGAYIVMPDKTELANRQMPEIRLQKPGFRCEFVRVPHINQADAKPSISRLFTGQRERERWIPVLSSEQSGDSALIRTWPDSGQLMVRHSGHHSQHYLLGTDQLGRDFLSRLILGARISISVGLMAVLISLLIGVIIGMTAGFFRGWVDDVLMYLISVYWSVPTVLLALSLALVLDGGISQVYLAIGFTMWIDIARITRGQVIQLREWSFVQAGKSLGFRSGRLMYRHIMPNIAGPLSVVIAANFAAAILLEAGLSFLGVGVTPPLPSWGQMLSENRTYLITGLPHLALAPGIAISLLVLAFFAIGNGLRDAVDVRPAKVN